MGIYLELHIAPSRIDASEWAKAWDLSLDLLRRYPLKLVRFQAETFGRTRRLLYTRQIEVDADDPRQRHWRISGDLDSRRMAETFALPRQLNVRATHKGEEGDLLLSIHGEIYGGCDGPSCWDLWGSKTQGYPYHHALMVVGMMLEDRFGPDVVIRGDFDRAQADRAARWAKDFAGLELPLPVLVDPARLVARLDATPQDKAKLIDVASELFIGERRHILKTCLDRWGSQRLRQWMALGLGSFSASMVGALDLMSDWLDVTGDVEGLCRLACLDSDGPGYEPGAFVEALLQSKLTAPAHVGDPLDALSPPPGEADSVEAILARFMLTQSLTPRHMDFRISADALASVLQEHFGEQAGHWRHRIERATDSHVNTAQRLTTFFDRIDERTARSPVATVADMAAASSLADLHPDWQMTCLLSWWRAARLVAQIPAQAAQARYFPSEPNELRERLATLTLDAGMILTEDAWAWIDQEDDPQILLRAFALQLVARTKGVLRDLQWGLLENPALCRELQAALADPEKITSLRRWMKEKGFEEEGDLV